MLNAAEGCEGGYWSAVVVARLKKVDTICSYEVDQTMLLCDASRPNICTEIFEWLWLPDPAESFTHDGFDQGENTQRSATIGLGPVA